MLFEYFILIFYFLITIPYIAKLKSLMLLNFNWFLMIVVGLSLHYFLFYLILKIKKFGKVLLTLLFLFSYGIYMSSLFLFNYKMDRAIIASALENETEMIFYFITFQSVLITLIAAGLFYFVLTKIKFNWNINKYCLSISTFVVLILVLFAVITKNRVYLLSYPIIDCFDLLKVGKTLTGFDKGNKLQYETNNLQNYFTYNGSDNINVVLVIGESVRNDYFEKYSKKLDELNVIRFNNSKSDYFYTRDSVPEMLTLSIDNKNFSLVDIMNSAGFNTHWIGSQSIRGATDSPYSHFAIHSKNRIYKESNRNIKDDFELLDYIDNFLYDNGKNFYIVHMIGSHTPFYYRFNEEDALLDNYCKTKDMAKCTFEEISNAYINTIDYSTRFLYKLIEKFKNKNTILFFTSDHSVDVVYINKDENRQIVPAFMWVNKVPYNKNNIINNSTNFHHKKLTSSILNCAGFDSVYINNKLCN